MFRITIYRLYMLLLVQFHFLNFLFLFVPLVVSVFLRLFFGIFYVHVPVPLQSFNLLLLVVMFSSAFSWFPAIYIAFLSSIQFYLLYFLHLHLLHKKYIFLVLISLTMYFQLLGCLPSRNLTSFWRYYFFFISTSTTYAFFPTYTNSSISSSS